MKHSIALKIFSLAVGVLIMMIVAAVLNSLQVIHLGNQVRNISEMGLPISIQGAELNESGLRRRIAFERLYREYQSSFPDSVAILEAETNFEAAYVIGAACAITSLQTFSAGRLKIHWSAILFIWAISSSL